MNASTALARVLVDELVRCGVREVVLAPGSRSAPLAYAVQSAERAGRLRLHVRVDERSAGFLALGLAKLSRRPAVVITTSGTAVANLHPAVLEAHHADVPLVVLSADRPDELRGTGANQTTVQPGIFGPAVRWQHDLTHSWGGSDRSERLLGEIRTAQTRWRTTVDRAWAAAVGALGSPGPVHLNVAFRDPLAPDLPGADRAVSAGHAPPPDPSAPDVDPLPPELAGRPDGRPWTEVTVTGTGLPAPVGALADTGRQVPPAEPEDPPAHDDPRAPRAPEPSRVRTLMVLGDLPDPALTEQALTVAEAQGWPVVAEPYGAGDRAAVLPHGSLLLTASAWLGAHLPERVVVVGRCTLNRETGALLRWPGVRVDAVTATDDWADPSHAVDTVHPWSALVTGALRGQDPTWAQGWREAGRAITGPVSALVAGSWPSGPAVAQTVLQTLGEADVLVLGSSNAARDVDRAGLAGHRLLVTGNRGLAGIDGTLATAVGIALTHGATVAQTRATDASAATAPGRGRTVGLVGDLTFLHDLNGLLIGPLEPRPDLTLVVVNDDGGGIFGTLEYGEPERADDFERVFGTPTGADLQALATAYSVPFERVRTAAALRDILDQPARGVRVVEVTVPRTGQRPLRAALTEGVAEVLAELP
ncbi:2-succinyl-5-enolpyruvyl-6-hydroxy-3-cyclohexene-1-carboxylic-acid synthase [Ornithinimicrobium cavernae]|uniref:2-succinyl-5-enolpyruvyl-6-hydroxy-3- cyclohexene-1-carboxylic-acid synthase n=1 Tax=Ornithinimicrobium cavernae TaxID=2666047 RepID=UPI000D69829A|nr:2-succinyl-5-enolpyruvyl-6-hydroxy-3-cyclohexene-1-carboxylic-acid synthase [Ornithinimicrobium cavernae]